MCTFCKQQCLYFVYFFKIRQLCIKEKLNVLESFVYHGYFEYTIKQNTTFLCLRSSLFYFFLFY